MLQLSVKYQLKKEKGKTLQKGYCFPPSFSPSLPSPSSPPKTQLGGSNARNVGVLDTLAQLRHGQKTPLENSLQKRAFYKHISNEILFPLIDLGSSLKKSYWNSYHCSRVLTQEGDKIRGAYCKNRWCLVCERIRMAKTINGYAPQLLKLKGLQFTTLTAPLVEEAVLREEISKRKKLWYNIKKSLKRQGIEVNGLIKMEIVPKHNALFNLHFHIIHDGKRRVGKKIIGAWLARNPDSVRQAQDTRRADMGSLVELVKYQAKAFSKEFEGGKKVLKSAPAVQLDAMYRALKNFRVLQPFGKMRRVSEEFDDLVATIEAKEAKNRVWVYHQEVRTWVCTYGYGCGELLTDPTKEEDIIVRIGSSCKSSKSSKWSFCRRVPWDYLESLEPL